MPNRGARILVDTNAITAAYQTRCWNLLRNVSQLETVTLCLEEATRPDRRGRRLISRTLEELGNEILTHSISEDDRSNLAFRLQGRVDLDDGERDLLAQALKMPAQVWWLCGPDLATLRAMHLLGLVDRMCCLEELAQTAGSRAMQFAEQHTQKWLSRKRMLLLTGGLFSIVPISHSIFTA